LKASAGQPENVWYKEANMNQRIERAYENRPKNWVFEASVAVVFLALLVWSASAVETSGTTQNGGKIAINILKGIFQPDTKLLFNLTVQGVPYLLLETICIAFLGTVVGAIISIPLAFLSASNLTPKPVAFIGRIIIMAIRTVPPFIYGLMFVRVTGPGAFAGLLTMSLCSVGMVSKMYIEAIEDLDTRVLESLDAAGCSAWQKIRYGILPQLMPNFASTAIYRFDINLRDATVLGLVGAGGIGAPLIFAMNAYRWNEAGAILAGLIVLVLIVEWISTKIRVKLTRG
jgi:phosphonate transport system permease protein